MVYCLLLRTKCYFFLFHYRMEESERMERRERDKLARAKMSQIQREPEPDVLFTGPVRVSIFNLYENIYFVFKLSFKQIKLMDLLRLYILFIYLLNFVASQRSN